MAIGLNCSICGLPVNDTDDRCAKCGGDIGFPNVRAAAAESGVLNQRYEAALELARKQGSIDSVNTFEARMKTTFAVISVKLGFLHMFLSDKKQLYANYQLGVNAQTRKAAEAENDRHRVGTDGMLFGSYGHKIRYAALSLDGRGPSYGDLALRLENIAVRDRASLLEENSYDFVDHHNLRRGRIPAGYRAVWQERHKLAVAKLSTRLSGTTMENEHAQLLLSASGKRSSDEFIEVHIFGPIDMNVIESVRGKSMLPKKGDRALTADVKLWLKRAGKKWIEE